MIRYFEQIEAWKDARVLIKSVYEITRNGTFAKDYALKDQIRRAAISISANIAEGFDRGSNKEFLYFLAIAKGSAGEVRALLYTALDAGHITETEFATLTDKALSTQNKIGGFMHYLSRSPMKGIRHKRE